MSRRRAPAAAVGPLVAGALLSLPVDAAMTWPPSGWMSWGHFRCQVDCGAFPESCISEDLYKSTADALVKGGFADAGYLSVHVDDCWQHDERDPSTYKLVANATRFPSGLNALGDYLHTSGLYFGFYSALYYRSCEDYPASRGNEFLDVSTFVGDWGIDYLKLDGCDTNMTDGIGYYPYGYKDAGLALQQSGSSVGKSLVYSCSWPAYLPPDETKKPFGAMIADGCNLWRNYADIQPYWSSLKDIIEHWGTYGYYMKQFADGSHIHDADMLIVGEPNISDDEGRTQMAIWSIIMSPLLISADVRNISASARDILLNPEVLAVSRDTKYEMGYRILNYPSSTPGIDINAAGTSVWARNMSDSSVAFALYNSNDDAAANITVAFSDLYPTWTTTPTTGGSATYRVRDLWARQDVSTFDGLNFTGNAIPPHGTGFYRVWRL